MKTLGLATFCRTAIEATLQGHTPGDDLRAISTPTMAMVGDARLVILPATTDLPRCRRCSDGAKDHGLACHHRAGFPRKPASGMNLNPNATIIPFRKRNIDVRAYREKGLTYKLANSTIMAGSLRKN